MRRGATVDDNVGHLFRLTIALIMATLSIASAYITHIAAERGSRAAGLYVVASQQLAEEQQAEQYIDAVIAQDRVVTTRLDVFSHANRRNRAEANALVSTDRARAAEQDLRSQEASVQFSHLWPLLRVSTALVSIDERLTYDEQAARGYLRSMDPRLFRVPSTQTRDLARSAAELTTHTVLVVLILVLSLFLLTLAHVIGRTTGALLGWFAAAVAGGALVWFTSLGPRAAIPVIGLIIAAIVLIVVARVSTFRHRFAGMDHPDGVADVGSGPPQVGATATANPAASPSSRFDRMVVIAIAFATLLGAGVGYLQGQSSRAAEEHAWIANDRGVQAIGALRTAEEATASRLDIYAEAIAVRVSCWDAAQRAEAADAVGDAISSAYWSTESEQLSALAERLAEHSEFASALGPGGIDDLVALAGVRAEGYAKPAKLTGEQHAANASAKNLGDRSGGYLTVLSWLAVAVYLLGLSLVFRDLAVRRILGLLGIALISLALGLSVGTTMLSGAVPRADVEASASAYADGIVAMNKRDYQSAVHHFTVALQARPDFGLANSARADAVVQSASSPDAAIRAGFPAEAVDRAIGDLQAARGSGVETPNVMLSLGALLIHRSVDPTSQEGVEARITDMKNSVAYSRAGLRLGAGYDPEDGAHHSNQIVGRLNVALALLGSGDPVASRKEYLEASAEIATMPQAIQHHFVTAGMVTLELLRNAPHPVTAEQIAEMKEILAVSVYPAQASSTTITDTRAEVSPGWLKWRATIHDFNSGHDTLAVHWYYRDPAVGEWEAIPDASGLVDQSGTVPGRSFLHLRGDSYSGGSSVALSGSPGRCLRPGTYRAEFYLNGVLTAEHSADWPQAQPAYRKVFARDSGGAMCTPDDWMVSQKPGFFRVARSADGERGVALFNVQMASLGVDIRAAAIDRVVNRGSGLPAGLTPYGALSYQTGAIFDGRSVVWRSYRYAGGTARVGAIQLPSGRVLVACAYGDDKWIRSSEAAALLESFTALAE